MKYSFWIKTVIFFLCLAAITLALSCLLGAFDLGAFTDTAFLPTEATPTSKYTTVIIDAGHGGEDGGASSKAGLVEKDVNLKIALLLRDELEKNGITVVLTREDDRLLYDRNTDYKGRKKKLDLAARLAVADSTPDAIFISIHMNSFTDPRYSGLQVWYSLNNSDSFPLAELIRGNNQDMLQNDNTRATKAATSAINILHNAKCPAVLVECGFLSNTDEAALFETDEYRRKIAQMLCFSIVEFLQKSVQMP